MNPSDGPSASIESAVSRGFLFWDERDCAAPRLELVGYASEAEGSENTISWTSQATIELPADVVATTDLLFQETDEGWQIVEADILINDEMFMLTPSLLDGSKTRLDRVVAHEAGHVLGLAHPCRATDDPADQTAEPCSAIHESSLMHPIYYTVDETTISADEREGLCAVYGGVSPAEPPPCDDDRCATPEPVDTELGAQCDDPGVCASGICIVDDDSGYCSMRCRDNRESCGDGFTCREIRESGFFCVMDEVAACSASSASVSSHAHFIVFLVCLLVVLRRDRRWCV